jgi:2-polyprenyl-3-methyl-5-hydroxy-6-metoxy-1,4-benzoquinol methylase
LTFLMNEYNIKSFLDVGCGPGGMVALAGMRGLDAMGIDGIRHVR